MSRTLVFLMCAATASACAPQDPAFHAEAPAHAAPRRSVVLVAIDGVRWQDVFLGVDPELANRYRLGPEERVDARHLVPNLHRLMTAQGAAIGAPGAGASMEASGPNFVSLPGYMEMLTGRTDTGCTSNDCERVSFATVADDVASGGFGVAAVVTSWTGIGRAASAYESGVVVSVGRHGGSGRSAFEHDPAVARALSDAEGASPEPGYDDFRPDAHTARVALAFLMSEQPGFLFVGLGETDEYGHRNDYRGYLRALHEADAVIGAIAEAVARLGREGHPTTLFVTTDHGRAAGFSSHGSDYPESSRVWLVAAGAEIQARGWIPSERPHRLCDLSQTIRAVVGLPLVRVRRAGSVVSELFVAQPVLAGAL